jgi:uncharacterized protein (UPF0261 family)
VNAARGPAAVVLPLRGCSSYELADGPFVDEKADAALFEAVRTALRRDVPLREVDANVNDPEVAEVVLAAFDEVWGRRRDR